MHEPDPETLPRLQRLALFSLGWFFLAIAMAGALIPLVPTTPFLLLALWAFSRSSRRFHRWLLNHRVFGPSLRAWEAHRVIPLHAKVFAVCGMAGAMGWVTFFSPAPWYAIAAMGAVVLYGSWYVLSKPSRAPADA